MSLMGQRIRELRKSRNMTQSELGEIINASKSTVSQYESGFSRPDYETLIKIANYFRVSSDYLLGLSNMPGSNSIDILAAVEDNENYLTAGDKPITHEHRMGIIRVLDNPKYMQSVRKPILGLIHAGLPLLAEENWEGEVDVPSQIKGDFCLKVEGDSMIYAGILPGDIAIFQESNIAQHGQIVATGVEAETWEAYLKFFIRKNGQIVLRSANPEYEDIEFGPGHRVIGVMVGLIREQAPGLGDYQNMLQVKGYEDKQWVEIIEAAAGGGIEPEFVRQFVENQINMALKLAKKKSP